MFSKFIPCYWYWVMAAVVMGAATAVSREKRQLDPSFIQQVNIDALLADRRAVEYQIDCVVYDGPCDQLGNAIKEGIQQSIQGRCEACTPQVMAKVGRVARFIQNNYPQAWRDGLAKFLLGK